MRPNEDKTSDIKNFVSLQPAFWKYDFWNLWILTIPYVIPRYVIRLKKLKTK